MKSKKETPTCKNKAEIYCSINKTKLRPIGDGSKYQCPRCEWIYDAETKKGSIPEFDSRTSAGRQKIIERQFDSIGYRPYDSLKERHVKIFGFPKLIL